MELYNILSWLRLNGVDSVGRLYYSSSDVKNQLIKMVSSHLNHEGAIFDNSDFNFVVKYSYDQFFEVEITPPTGVLGYRTEWDILSQSFYSDSFIPEISFLYAHSLDSFGEFFKEGTNTPYRYYSIGMSDPGIWEFYLLEQILRDYGMYTLHELTHVLFLEDYSFAPSFSHASIRLFNGLSSRGDRLLIKESVFEFNELIGVNFTTSIFRKILLKILSSQYVRYFLFLAARNFTSKSGDTFFDDSFSKICSRFINISIQKGFYSTSDWDFSLDDINYFY